MVEKDKLPMRRVLLVFGAGGCVSKELTMALVSDVHAAT